MKHKVERDPIKESRGWLTLAVIMICFPAIFLICVWLPIWLDAAPRWP